MGTAMRQIAFFADSEMAGSAMEKRPLGIPSWLRCWSSCERDTTRSPIHGS